MTKDKTDKKIKTAAAAIQSDELKQFKILMYDENIEALKKYARTIGVGHTTAARQIIIEFLSKIDKG